MYQPKNPETYKKKAQETLKIFRRTGGDVGKAATKLNRGVRTIYRHLNYLGYKFPEADLDRDELGRLKPREKGEYLKNLERVKTNGK